MKLAHEIWSHLPAADAQAFYSKWAAPLERSINATQTDPEGSGLLWSNTSAPNVGYGFQVVPLSVSTVVVVVVVVVVQSCSACVRVRAWPLLFVCLQ